MGALWDSNAKRWYITEHHNPEDFKFWSPCEDDEQEIEEEEDLTADDYIDDIYEHLNKLYDLIPEKQTTTINKEEEPVELLEKEETPQEEYSRHLEEIKKEASSDKSTYHQVFRISPESLALIYMSDEKKKYLIN
tara:strand:+ start:3231 stop:3635 length:405 start_codon:yes stop_codon:yes gene_type:complete